MARYNIVDFQGLEGPVKKVRRALGARAFGVNFFDLPPGSEGHEHDETERDHEEVYVYVRGSGTLRLDGEELEVREGLAVRVDPVVRRQLIAGDEGLAWVAIGAPRDARYEPPDWG